MGLGLLSGQRGHGAGSRLFQGARAGAVTDSRAKEDDGVDVGFTVICRGTEVTFEVHSGSSRGFAALLSVARTGSGSAVLLGRLYYRDELLAALAPCLPGPFREECRQNEAALALAAHQHLGEVAAARLEGDFALAVWDAAASRLVGHRDPMGGYPLFWISRGDTFALGTSLTPLLRLLGRRSLDMDYLADFLMIRGQRNEGPEEACAYEGVRRVLPGTSIRCSVPGNRVERRRNWDWDEHVTDPGSDVGQAAEQLAAVLGRAVRERIRGRTLAHLSGGMDSTAVALLARQAVAAGAGVAPLHTLTLVYEGLPKLARERDYAEKVLASTPGIVAHRLEADELLDFDGFADAPPHDEPYDALWRLAMDRAAVEVGAGAGADTILTGFGADDLFEVQPFHLADLVRRGRLVRAWREACRWAGARNCGPWEVLSWFALDSLAPRAPAWLWSVPPLGNLRTAGDWAVPAWVTPAFAWRHRLRRRGLANARRAFGRCPQAAESVLREALAARSGDVIRWSVAAPLGLAMTHPFLDPRVVGLCLGARRRFPPEPGPMKPLLARALHGLLPEHIVSRRAKGHFDEVYFLGLARNLDRLEEVVRQAPLDDLGIFDRGALLAQLEGASLGGATPQQRQQLNRALSLIKWLGMRERWHREGPPTVLAFRHEPATPAGPPPCLRPSPINGTLPTHEGISHVEPHRH